MSLKHLSNCWRILDRLLINYEINLILDWSKNYVITSKATRDADRDANTSLAEVKDIINSYNYLLKKANFSIKTSNE